MARIPPGIQLGSSRTPVLLRVLTAASALALAGAAVGAWEMRRHRQELAAIGTTATGSGASPAAADRELDRARSREAATLLRAGAERSARFGTALDAIAAAGPGDLRITGVELRPRGEAGGVEAAVAAEAPTSDAIAAFLASLAGMEAVQSTGEIQETRTSAGFVSVRVTVRLGPQRPEGF